MFVLSINIHKVIATFNLEIIVTFIYSTYQSIYEAFHVIRALCRATQTCLNTRLQMSITTMLKAESC